MSSKFLDVFKNLDNFSFSVSDSPSTGLVHIQPVDGGPISHVRLCLGPVWVRGRLALFEPLNFLLDPSHFEILNKIKLLLKNSPCLIGSFRRMKRENVKALHVVTVNKMNFF